MRRLRKWQNRQIAPFLTQTSTASVLLQLLPFSSTLLNMQSSFASRKTCYTVLSTLFLAVIPCTCDTAALEDHWREELHSFNVALSAPRSSDIMSLNHRETLFHGDKTMRSLDETQNTSDASDNRNPVRIFFGYFLIGIAGISLLGWAYIFYLRISYSRKIKEEEQIEGQGYVVNSNKCCKGNGMGVFPIEPDGPPRSYSEGVANDEQQQDVESHPMHRHHHRQQQQQQQHHRPSPKRSMTHHKKEEMIQSEDQSIKGKIQDDDSFARELQIAARVDRHVWVEHENRKKAMEPQRPKKAPSLHPSETNMPYFSGFQGFDFFGWKNGWGGESGNATSQNEYEPQSSPKVSYLPTRLQSQPQEHYLQTRPLTTRSRVNDNRTFYRSVQGEDDRGYPQHLEMNDSDPSDVILSDSSSANYSSAASSSYAGKNSSVEEGERDGEDGFELIGYLDGRKDGMNEYLLNPIPVSDDASFGNASGMEMSLGANTATTNQTSSSLGRGSEKRGFYVIKEDYDLMHEYIPKEEYDAAVMAVTEVLKNSPRNSPRNSPQRARQETMPINHGGNITKSFLSAPSDERNYSRRSESNSLSGYESNSINPYNTQTSLDSSTTDSDSKLSKDIFNELKNVSAFIRRYEKKKSSKRTQNGTQNSEQGYDTIDSSNDASTFNSSNSQPSMTVTSASETDSAFQGDKKQRIWRPSLGKKKKDRVVEHEVGDFEVKVKSKKRRSKKTKSKLRVFPPRYPSHKKVGDFDREEYDDDDDDDVIIVANSPTHGSRLQRRQLPVAGNGEHPGIGMNPSGESSASDANFLRSEIESFFSQKDTSMSVMSESIEVLHIPATEKSKPIASKIVPIVERTPRTPNPIHKTPVQLPVGSERALGGDSGRLGAAPFDPSEPPPLVLDQNDKKRMETTPPSTVRVKEKKHKNLTPLASSKKDTLPVYGNKYDSSPPPEQIPLAQSAKTMLQSGAKSIASMIDRTRQSPKVENGNSHLQQDIESGEASINKIPREQGKNTATHPQSNKNPTLAGLETRLQYGARSILSMFETKENDGIASPHPSSSPQRSQDNPISGTISNRLEQIRRSVKYRAANANKTNTTLSPKSLSSPKSFSSPKSHSYSVNGVTNKHTQKDKQVVAKQDPPPPPPPPPPPTAPTSRKVQVATFVTPEEEQNMISPTSTHGLRNFHPQRTPGKLLRPDIMSISQQSGDDTTESPSRTNRDATPMNVTSSPPPNIVSTQSSRFSPPDNHRDANNHSGSTVGSTTSNTRNLISIFESRRASNNGIFPPGEHWQYTGKLKPQRNTTAR